MKNAMSVKMGVAIWVVSVLLLTILGCLEETPRTYLNPDRANECAKPGNDIPPLPLDECLEARKVRKDVG